MKKMYMIAIGVLLVAGKIVNAQENLVFPERQIAVNSAHPLSVTKVNATESRWLNYARQLIEIGGLPSKGFIFSIFPDSIIQDFRTSTGQIIRPGIHKAATILDPKNMPNSWLNMNSSYTLDSVAFTYAYYRTTASTVKDTLVIDIIKGDDNLVTNINSKPPRLPYTYQDIMYNYSTDKIVSFQLLTSFTYILSEVDSITKDGSLITPKTLKLKVPSNVQQTNGERIGIVLSFKPGYSYTSDDSLSGKNAFYLGSFEENGVNTNAVFHGTFQDKTSDLNCSYVLPTDIRYNNNKNGWNGFFIPTWEQPTYFAYENHDISFLLSSDNVGIQENNAANGIKLFQNQPNPSNGSTLISYELERNSSITFSVYDITGKRVMELNEGRKMPGKYSIIIDKDKLKSGIYFYTLTGDSGNSLTRKMIITE